jgi:LysR family glycine cleavage system transcriptional activator
VARSLPPLGWFRSFDAAARHLNFTVAARELALTQSAVSQQVRSLETRLGVQLFVRLPRGLALTDEGRTLLPQIEAALGTLAKAAQAFETGPPAGLLTIATSVSIAQWILAPQLHRFQAAHPELRVRLLSTVWSDEFKSSIADVEIRFGSQKQARAGAVRLLPDRLIAVAERPVSGPLLHRPLIETVGTSSGWEAWAQCAGFQSKPEPAIFVDSYGLALDLAVQGNGVALTSSLLAAGPLASGRLVQVHPVSIANAEGFFLTANQLSEPARAFEAWVMARVQI